MDSDAAGATNWAVPGTIGSTTPNTGAFTTLTTTGNVGIGTTIPSQPLEVTGNVRVNGAYMIGSNILLNYGGSANDLIVGSGFSEYTRIQNGGSATGAITLSSGNVGIGTSSPLSRLHTANSTGDNSLYVDAGTPATIAGTSELLLNSSRAETGVGHVVKIDSVASAIGKADMAFLTQASAGVYTERMRIDNAGNVGIGTTLPNNWLQVNNLINFDDTLQSTFLGKNSGIVTTGSFNTFVGYTAGAANTSGWINTAVGHAALSAATTGQQDTAFGAGTLKVNTAGYRNTGIGNDALNANTTGFYNVALGEVALRINTTGTTNTSIGAFSGYSNTTGAGNVFLGYQADYNEIGSNKLYIANSNTNPPLIYGDFSQGYVGIGTTSPATALEVNGGVRLATATAKPTCDATKRGTMWIERGGDRCH